MIVRMARPIRYCDVDGCERRRFGGGLCQMHYTRQRKHGDVTAVKPPGRTRLETCSVDKCERGGPIKRGLCPVHYDRRLTAGDLPVTRNLAEDVGYAAAHYRVRRARGRASLQPCIDCGSTAAQWSYDGTDPAERADTAGHTYSLDARRYQPRCHSCHSRFDETVDNLHA